MLRKSWAVPVATSTTLAAAATAIPAMTRLVRLLPDHVRRAGHWDPGAPAVSASLRASRARDVATSTTASGDPSIACTAVASALMRRTRAAQRAQVARWAWFVASTATGSSSERRRVPSDGCIANLLAQARLGAPQSRSHRIHSDAQSRRHLGVAQAAVAERQHGGLAPRDPGQRRTHGPAGLGCFHRSLGIVRQARLDRIALFASSPAPVAPD